MRWELWGLGENAGECKEEALLTLLKKDTIAERRKVSTFVGEDLLGTGGSWLLTQGFWKITVKEFWVGVLNMIIFILLSLNMYAYTNIHKLQIKEGCLFFVK